MDGDEVVKKVVSLFPDADVSQLTNAVMLAITLDGEDHRQILQRAMEIFIETAPPLADDDDRVSLISSDADQSLEFDIHQLTQQEREDDHARTDDQTASSQDFEFDIHQLTQQEREDDHARTDEQTASSQDFEFAVRLALEELENLPPATSANHKRPGSPDPSGQAGAKRRRQEPGEDLHHIFSCRLCENISDKFAMCGLGHVVCKRCLKPVITSVIAADESALKCPVANCKENINQEDLCLLEPSTTVQLFKHHLGKKQSLISQTVIQNLAGLVRCPNCNDAAVLEDTAIIFRCLNKECGRCSCRYCKAPLSVAFRFDGTPRLKRFDKGHEWCFILQYAGIACSQDLLTPTHWDVFDEEDYKLGQRKDHTLVPFGPPTRPGFLQSLYSSIFGDSPPSPSLQSQGQQGTYISVRLDPASQEFANVFKYHKKTSSFFPLVKEIYRVQNLDCWERYMVKRRNLVQELGELGVKEQFLYHTADTNMEDVCQRGFELHKPSVPTYFGKGIYFTPIAKRRENIIQGQRTFVFMACVLIGKITIGYDYFLQPPIDPFDGRRFDCCVDNIYSPSEYVIFSSDRCYPAYIIELECP